MYPTQPTRILKEKLLRAAADNKQFQAQILEIANLYENILSAYEMQALSFHAAIKRHIAQERKLIDIMETYGIDTSIALGRRDYKISSDHDLAISCNVYRVPEKLTNMIKIQI